MIQGKLSLSSRKLLFKLDMCSNACIALGATLQCWPWVQQPDYEITCIRVCRINEQVNIKPYVDSAEEKLLQPEQLHTKAVRANSCLP